MIRTRLTVNARLLDELIAYPDELAETAEREARDLYETYTPRLLDELRAVPPPPDYPVGEFPWVNERQRKRVMMILTQEAIARGDYEIGPRGGIVVTDLRYQRTGDLPAGWEVRPTFDGARFVLSVGHPWSGMPFVHGSPNLKSRTDAAEVQQPFHADRYPLLSEVANYYFRIIREEYTETMSARFVKDMRVIARRRSVR